MQRVVGVTELDVDRGARRVPPRVRERFLHDPVRGELDARVGLGDRPGHDEPGGRARGLPRRVDQLRELRQPRQRVPVGDRRAGLLSVFAEHAE